MIYVLFTCFTIANSGPCRYAAGPFDNIEMCRDYKARFEQGKAEEIEHKQHIKMVCMGKSTWQPVE